MEECGLFGYGPLGDKLLQEANDILFASKECHDKANQLLEESKRIVEALY